jgi:pilus assembly protein CpaF
VTTITEVAGMEGDVITMQDIFTLTDQRMTAEGKVEANLTATGLRPRFASKFEAYGVADAWISPPVVNIR